MLQEIPEALNKGKAKYENGIWKVTEEFWDILKKYKNPKINFKALQNKVFDKVRPIILNK